MSTIIRAQVTLPTSSGLPADDVMNVWHFQSNDIDPVDDCVGWNTLLLDFYNVIDAFMSGRLSGVISIDYYNLADASPRTPISHFDSTLSLGTGDALPHECAICLSYRGALGSGVNPARHRGRIYLGPWDVSVVDQGPGDTIVDVSVRNGIAAAAESLMNSSVTFGAPWVVYSPTTNLTETLVDSAFQVVAGHVDDAFDTIRSRGGAPTARSLFP